jgi:hypothetical protein
MRYDSISYVLANPCSSINPNPMRMNASEPDSLWKVSNRGVDSSGCRFNCAELNFQISHPIQ